MGSGSPPHAAKAHVSAKSAESRFMVRTLPSLARLRSPMAKKKTGKPRERTERRFVPQAATNPKLVYALGFAGALVLGAGAWGQFGNMVRKTEIEPVEWAPW